MGVVSAARGGCEHVRVAGVQAAREAAMNRILLAMLLSAAPAFAHGDERDHYDDGYQRESRRDHDGRSRDHGQYREDYGDWNDSADQEDSWSSGDDWRPRRVSGDWQPYVYGRWVWTQAGWAWASDEPFGWAVYHYGRWAWSPAFGWMWVPGRIWAPAWVSWRWRDRKSVV